MKLIYLFPKGSRIRRGRGLCWDERRVGEMVSRGSAGPPGSETSYPSEGNEDFYRAHRRSLAFRHRTTCRSRREWCVRPRNGGEATTAMRLRSARLMEASSPPHIR